MHHVLDGRVFRLGHQFVVLFFQALVLGFGLIQIIELFLLHRFVLTGLPLLTLAQVLVLLQLLLQSSNSLLLAISRPSKLYDIVILLNRFTLVEKPIMQLILDLVPLRKRIN